LDEVIDEIRSGKALGAAGTVDGLADVTLAQALEATEDRAADVFERQYMPLVRQTGGRLGGQRGEEHVENFAAELILPRADRPPRIAQFLGKTSLARWVCTVATNYCLSKFRAMREEQQCVEPRHIESEHVVSLLDSQPCLELVRPLVQEAVQQLPAADRLLLRWLALDGVPQLQVAKALGIHSGNVTRRRQKAVQEMLGHVDSAARRSGKQRAAADCLETLLSGNDGTAREQLSHWLVAAMPPAGAERAGQP
jgi:RNA polymerase sigma factor (sigma-70 family)